MLQQQEVAAHTLNTHTHAGDEQRPHAAAEVASPKRLQLRASQRGALPPPPVTAAHTTSDIVPPAAHTHHDDEHEAGILADMVAPNRAPPSFMSAAEATEAHDREPTRMQQVASPPHASSSQRAVADSTAAQFFSPLPAAHHTPVLTAAPVPFTPSALDLDTRGQAQAAGNPQRQQSPLAWPMSSPGSHGAHVAAGTFLSPVTTTTTTHSMVTTSEANTQDPDAHRVTVSMSVMQSRSPIPTSQPTSQKALRATQTSSGAAGTGNAVHGLMLRDATHVPSIETAQNHMQELLDISAQQSDSVQQRQEATANNQLLAATFGMSPPRHSTSPPAGPALSERIAPVALPPAAFQPAAGAPPFKYPNAVHISFNVAPSSSGYSTLSTYSHLGSAMPKMPRTVAHQAVVAEDAPELDAASVAFAQSDLNPLSAFGAETNSRLGDGPLLDEHTTHTTQPPAHPVHPNPIEEAQQQQMMQQAAMIARAFQQGGPHAHTGGVAPKRASFGQATTQPPATQGKGATPAGTDDTSSAPLMAKRAAWMQDHFQKTLEPHASEHPGIHTPGPHTAPAVHEPRVRSMLMPGQRPTPEFDLESTDSGGIDGGKVRKQATQAELDMQQFGQRQAEHHTIDMQGTAAQKHAALVAALEEEAEDHAPETGAFIAGADQDVERQMQNGGPEGGRKRFNALTMANTRAPPLGSPTDQTTADGPAGRMPPVAGGAGSADKMNSSTMSNFSSSLRWFKYLLLLGGLRQQTSAFYRWYIRITVWGCTLMCLINIALRTKSYRNPFFDCTLVIMHFWVSWSFEKWHVFTKSHHWRLLVSIVSQSKTGNFFTHINQVGVFGLVATAGATIMVCAGWIAPIVYETFTQYESGGRYGFLALHGVFMTLIIVPWAAACICSSVLFHMVVLAHQSDVEHYFQTVKSLLIGRDSAAGGNNIEETFGWLVRLHQPVRMRLRMTCHYFNSLYALAILVSIMLVCAGVADFNDLIVNQNPVWHFVIQDAFFLALGIVAMYGSLWVTSSLTNYWLRFVQRINELPQFLLTHPAAHSGLVAYFKTADVAYTVFGMAVNPKLIQAICGGALKCLFIALIIYNWRYFPPQTGTIVLAPPQGPT